MTRIPLAAVNEMSGNAFVTAFGNVAEHAPWVAADAASRRPFAARDDMIDAFCRAIGSADEDRQRALLLAHPDLAGKAAIAGTVTDASRREQSGAGLDHLTDAEFADFTRLNEAYRTRHGIPFVFAVRGATKHAILDAFRQRLHGARETEFATAIDQVCRIVRFRLEDRVAP